MSLDTPTTDFVSTLAFNELVVGAPICMAVEENRRADFALLVAMFSDDLSESVPVETIDEITTSEDQLRVELNVAKAQALRSNSQSYDKSAAIANQFHQGGMQSARLQNGLNPDSLAYLTEYTHDLGEEVYRNLSFHTQRALKSEPKTMKTDGYLYNELICNMRERQIRLYQ